MSAFITELLAGWRAPLLWALLGATIAGSGAWEVRGWRTASLVAAANTAQVRAEKALSDLRAEVATNVAELERLRADEQTKALTLAKAQNRKLLDLQARLAASERERIEVATKLKEELIDAPEDDVRSLGPAVLRYLDRVRAEQSAP